MAASVAYDTKTLMWGFIAGALAVLIFHQAAVLVMNGFDFGRIWRMSPGVPPFAVPPILNLMFWGGVWGIVFAAISPMLPRGMMYLLCGLLFGGIVLVLSSWYLVPFIKSLFGQTGLRYGPNPAGWWRGSVINGMWGLGTALLLQYLPRGR